MRTGLAVATTVAALVDTAAADGSCHASYTGDTLFVRLTVHLMVIAFLALDVPVCRISFVTGSGGMSVAHSQLKNYRPVGEAMLSASSYDADARCLKRARPHRWHQHLHVAHQYVRLFGCCWPESWA
eukprot:COSAG01_NODE_40506_length_462_cov_10.289256_1_plen_126_part_10